MRKVDNALDISRVELGPAERFEEVIVCPISKSSPSVSSIWAQLREISATKTTSLPPFIFADPRDHAAWGGNAFNLALVGATWIFADAIATRHPSIQNQQSAKPSPV